MTGQRNCVAFNQWNLIGSALSYAAAYAVFDEPEP